MLACAKAAHEAIAAYCEAIGDPRIEPWERAPSWQQASSLDGVRGVLDDGNDERASHVSWMKHKIAEGWIWGPTKNEATKEHPCVVPYEELPEPQRRKDTIFVATVRGMASALGHVAKPSGRKGET